MNIVDLAILKKMVAGGGGSGTDNYNDLSNLPQINGETLAGNKTAANLGLQDALTFDSAPTEDSTNPVESGGVYNALAGKQDNLTFDDDPTENSTNPVKSGGVYSALAGKQDNLTFDGVYNASTNKAATESTVTNAIAGLDVSALSVDADETISSISETDGKINVTKQDIAIVSNQVTAMTGYTKPSSAPATPAIQTSDTANQAFGKLEFKADTNQSNILCALHKTGTNYIYDYIHGMENPTTLSGVTFTWLDNGKLSIKSTGINTSRVWYDFEANIRSKYVGKILSFVGGVDNKCVLNVTTTGGEAVATSSGADVTIPSTGTNKVYILVYENVGEFDIVVEPMIRDATITSNTYSAPSLPNYDLTRLESEDRAALAEEIDAGAKNKWDFANVQTGNWHATTSKTDTSFTITSTDIRAYFSMSQSLPAGHYVFSAKISNLSGPDYKGIAIRAGSSGGTSLGSDITFSANGIISGEFTCTATTTVYFVCYASMDSFTGATSYTASDIMVATKAAFGVSKAFVPFDTDPFYQVPINHNMIYRGRNLGASLTDAQHTALSSGNFTDLYLGDYWTKTVTIPAGTYTGGDGEEVTVPAQTNITLKAVIADFDTFYAGYASTYAGINTHHAAVIVTGFSNVVWNKTNSTAGGYVASLIHKWLVGSALPQIETWFGSAKVLSHQKLLTNAITGDAASEWAWSSQKISLLSENQMYGSKVWGNSKAANGGYEPGEAFKHLNVFNHIDANLLFGNKSIWLRDIASAVKSADLNNSGYANSRVASDTGVAPAALILLS